MKRFIVSSVLAISLTFMPLNMMLYTDTGKVYAESQNTLGLIEKCSLSCTSSEGAIKITAKTQVSGIMSEIGCLDIRIQRSDDCKSWTDEVIIGNLTAENTRHYTINNYSVNVAGGYYYRVTCTHYARGVPFADVNEISQTAENFSGAVWVDKSKDINILDTSTDVPSYTEQVNSATTASETTASSTTISTPSIATLSASTSAAVSTTETTATTSVTQTVASAQSSSETGTSSKGISTSHGTSAVNTKIDSAKNSPDTGVDTPLPLIFTSLGTGALAVTLRKKH